MHNSVLHKKPTHEKTHARYKHDALWEQLTEAGVKVIERPPAFNDILITIYFMTETRIFRL